MAATMFSEEILTEYPRTLSDTQPSRENKGMAVVKHRNGNYCLRAALTDGYMPLIELTSEEEASSALYMPMNKQDKTS